MTPFYGWCSPALRLLSHYKEIVCFWPPTFYQLSRNSWNSLDQSRKEERLRWPRSHPVILNSCINLVITKYKLEIKVTIYQTNSIMNLYCELNQSEFSALSSRIIRKLPKICSFCTYVDQMITEQKLMFAPNSIL